MEAAGLPIGIRRERLQQRALGLARLGLLWHLVEAAVALAAGIAAASVALVGFGADSLVELLAGAVLVWRFGSSRAASGRAERRAQQLIAASFAAIALYIAADGIGALAGGHEPDASGVGIALSIVTLLTMPALARAKTRVARRLHSSATASEARQTTLCAYLSAALLVGLVANAAFGLWWADPAAGLVIAAVAGREARAAWRGDACCGVAHAH